MIRNNTEIAILLSTYNGEKYLRDQLDSLFAQTFNDFALFVRDDCSTDSTLQIIKEYQKTWSNIIILDHNGKNLGAQMSFMTLLENIDSHYYMFMDQDDVWFKNKIEKEYIKITEIECDNLAMVYTDAKVVDNHLNIINESLWKYSHYIPGQNDEFLTHAIGGNITGCTMIFNRKAKEVSFPVASYSKMHDWWVAMCVLHNNGNIGFISEPTMLYRRHRGTVTRVGEKKHHRSIFEKFNTFFCVYHITKTFGLVHSFPQFIITRYKILKKLRKQV